MKLVNFMEMTSQGFYKRYFWLCLALFPLLGAGQQGEFKKGQIGSIALDSTSKASYYLPSKYHVSRSWPVIYVFDPSGRDQMAVEVFQSAAEKYGYIVVSSGAIKNGSYQENYRRARVLFETTDVLFRVDSINRFTAGFSGGARLASAIAGLSKNVRGVLAAGAGVVSRNLMQDQVESFVYVGMGGDEGFNYVELKSTGRLLKAIKLPYEIIWFDGGHEWPPAAVTEKAVRDLTVKMHSRGQQLRSPEQLEAMFAEDMNYNRQLREEGHLVWAYNDLQKMRVWYGFMDKEGELKKEMKAVKRMNGYRTQRRAFEYIDEMEPRYLEEYVDFLIADIGAGDLEALGYWDQEMKHLDKSFSAHKEMAYRKMAIRIKSMLRVIGDQAKNELEEPAHFKQLLFTNIFLTLTDDHDYDAHLEAVRLAVALGDYDIALYYTDKLLENGFKDVSRLRDYPGITLLRIQPEFGEILEKYGFKSRF